MIYISFSQSQQNILNVHNHHQIIIITDKIKSVVFILPRVLTSSTGRGGAAMVFWGWGGVPGVQGDQDQISGATYISGVVILSIDTIC